MQIWENLNCLVWMHAQNQTSETFLSLETSFTSLHIVQNSWGVAEPRVYSPGQQKLVWSAAYSQFIYFFSRKTLTKIMIFKGDKTTPTDGFKKFSRPPIVRMLWFLVLRCFSVNGLILLCILLFKKKYNERSWSIGSNNVFSSKKVETYEHFVSFFSQFRLSCKSLFVLERFSLKTYCSSSLSWILGFWFFQTICAPPQFACMRCWTDAALYGSAWCLFHGILQKNNRYLFQITKTNF